MDIRSIGSVTYEAKKQDKFCFVFHIAGETFVFYL